MEKQIKRPVSVWITQILLAIGIFVSPLFFLNKIFSLFSYCSTNGLEKCLSANIILDLISNCLILILIILAFLGLQRRKLYGRWLGMIFLLLLMFLAMFESHYFQIIYNLITTGEPLPTPPYECWQDNIGSIEKTYCGYESYLDFWVLGILDIFFPSSLFALLAMHLVSSRATNYFFSLKAEK